MKDYIEIQLENPLKNCHIGNERKDVNILYAKCWNLKDHKYTTISLRNKFKELFIEGVQKLTNINIGKSEDESDNNEEEIKTEAIKEILSLSNSEKYINFLKEFESFLSNNILFKDNELKVAINKEFDLPKISQDDIENIICKYIEIFFISLWLKKNKT